MSEQKIERFWRDATADDIAEIVKAGKAKEARFRDELKDHWISGSNSFLAGGIVSRRDVIIWISKTTARWKLCQVYDPPAWFLNKPDPGEGYRLLEKFPPEDLQKGDEAFGNNRDGEWGRSDYAERGCRNQCKTLWYRRRIANNPEIPDSCRSRDNIPSGWRLLGKDEERLASDAYWSALVDSWVLIGDTRLESANRDKWPAIRQVDHQADYTLLAGFTYPLPNGQTIRVTAKGFEVL